MAPVSGTSPSRRLLVKVTGTEFVCIDLAKAPRSRLLAGVTFSAGNRIVNEGSLLKPLAGPDPITVRTSLGTQERA